MARPLFHYPAQGPTRSARKTTPRRSGEAERSDAASAKLVDLETAVRRPVHLVEALVGVLCEIEGPAVSLRLGDRLLLEGELHRVGGRLLRVSGAGCPRVGSVRALEDVPLGLAGVVRRDPRRQRADAVIAAACEALAGNVDKEHWQRCL